MIHPVKRIIVVDDDPSMRDAFALVLELPGYELNVLSDGKLLANGDFHVPDLFILDKQLSGSDGFELCRNLKQDDRSRHVPIILTTARANMQAGAAAAGADGFLEKPFSIRELRELLSKYI